MILGKNTVNRNQIHRQNSKRREKMKGVRVKIKEGMRNNGKERRMVRARVKATKVKRVGKNKYSSSEAEADSKKQNP